MIKEIPILFSTPMVQAILEGRKTVTRRVVKPQPPDNGRPVRFWCGWPGVAPCGTTNNTLVSPYRLGDVLWVREEHFAYGRWVQDGLTKSKKKLKYSFKRDEAEDILFSDSVTVGRETYKLPVEKNSYHMPAWYKRLGRFMPKAAARIWLEVVSVRVERLHDITEESAKAEGILSHESAIDKTVRYKDYLADASGYGASEYDWPTDGLAKDSFKSLWHSINGAESWDANPWVWVVEFKVLSTTGRHEANKLEGNNG